MEINIIEDNRVMELGCHTVKSEHRTRKHDESNKNIGNLALGNFWYWIDVEKRGDQITDKVPGIKLTPIAIITLDIV